MVEETERMMETRPKNWDASVLYGITMKYDCRDSEPDDKLFEENMVAQFKLPSSHTPFLLIQL